ncbi:BET1-like protein [Leptotrombidium deliense]|uniref:BET1-like protein n=1 Tax=Leptotrombidium deliense TaxID=299467 RepID=A0A443S3X5_9ACAR|nr:BET1-like protein [Leptotrombidium deliense]
MAKRANAYQYNSSANDGYSFLPQSPEVEGEVLVSGLRSKVSTLKSLTLDMGDEIRSQNAFLKSMDSDFDSTWGLLSSSFSRVKKLAAAGHNRFIFYLLGFSFFVFFIIYIIIRFR